jgi:hypothetical protein
MITALPVRDASLASLADQPHNIEAVLRTTLTVHGPHDMDRRPFGSGANT